MLIAEKREQKLVHLLRAVDLINNQKKFCLILGSTKKCFLVAVSLIIIGLLIGLLVGLRHSKLPMKYSTKAVQNQTSTAQMTPSRTTAQHQTSTAPMTSSTKAVHNQTSTAQMTSSRTTAQHQMSTAPMTSSTKTTQNQTSTAPMTSSRTTAQHQTSTAPMTSSTKTAQNQTSTALMISSTTPAPRSKSLHSTNFASGSSLSLLRSLPKTELSSLDK